MLVVSAALRPPLHCVEAAPPSTKVSALHLPLQRTKLQKNRWRIASARADDHASEWRRETRELRVEIQELQAALADAWVQDEIQILELEKLVSELRDVLRARIPAEVGNVVGNGEQASSEARDRELSVANFAIGRNEDEASEISKLELEGVDALDENAITVSELRSEELRAKQEGLSTLRRLKHLNVHDYVHSALQASHLRSWLRSRGIAE